MIALPAAIMTMLREIPMSAWGPLGDILRYIVTGGDGNDARVRAEALAAHALLHSFHPKPVAIATQPKAH